MDLEMGNTKIQTLPLRRKYMAPELRKNGELSKMTDIFSLGVTILDVITGYQSFDHYSCVGNTDFIEKVKIRWKKERVTEAHLRQVDTCTNIAVLCIDTNSKKRPTIMQIVERLNNNTETKVSIQEWWTEGVPHHRSFPHSRMQSIQAQASDMTSLVADITNPGAGSEWRLLPWLMRGLICNVHRSIKNLDVGRIICVGLVVALLASLFLINSPVSLVRPHVQYSSSSSPSVAGKLPGSSSSGRKPLDVVIVYAFDCTYSTAAWYTVDDVFWLVQEKLTHLVDSRMGYIYVKMATNTYRSDMKLVDSAETRATGYKTFALRTGTCTKNMASGLVEAHKMLTDRRYRNGTILLFSDGLIHKGNFFDGAENFISEVPVHTFTLSGDAYNQGLHAIAANSPGGMFHTDPVPERPILSASFLRLLDTILGATTLDDDKPPTPSLGWEPLDVVIVYAFDCTHTTPAWRTMDDVFWLVQEKLTNFVDSCLGYIYFTLTGNTYTSDMKLVDSAETQDTGYNKFEEHTIACTKNMASGLAVAHKMINNRGYKNGSILLFSDGLIHKGDFFDGAENFISKVPVHTFTLGGNASNPSLQAIAKNSLGGTFNPIPVPERPRMSTSFTELLDTLLITGQ